jgi:ubiquinone/menaquinone biosynthesis C-methylase UbiE
MYEAVIRHDYMCHRELIEGVKKSSGEITGDLHIVDLGCGDAWLAAHGLQDAKVGSYLGVDLSESAVKRAREHVSKWGARAEVRRGNIAEFIETLADEGANFILASNSLHHFGSEQKTRILEQCHRTIGPGGIFCWIDVVRDEGDSRDDYLGRLTTVMRRDWVRLSEAQRARASDHVLTSDYPEAESWMISQAESAGFACKGRFLEHEFFGAWKFVKP